MATVYRLPAGRTVARIRQLFKSGWSWAMCQITWNSIGHICNSRLACNMGMIDHFFSYAPSPTNPLQHSCSHPHRKVANTHVATHTATQHEHNQTANPPRSTNCPSSPAPTTLHKRTECFAVLHTPQHKPSSKPACCDAHVWQLQPL